MRETGCSAGSLVSMTERDWRGGLQGDKIRMA